MSEKKWFVAMCKPGRQDEVVLRLRGAEFDVFNPKLKQYNKKRATYLLQSLFPLYIFVKLDIEKDFRMIHYTRGVLRILGIGKTPHHIDELIIDELKKRCDSEEVVTAKHSIDDGIKKGDKVLVSNGPLEGVEAVVSGVFNDQERIQILFDMIKITVEKNKLRKL